MRLLSLEVQNYRNICAARLEPGRELTVICGNNGQGKTNLLEAIWLLTGGKSFRGGKDAELVRRGEAFAVLEADTQRDRPEGCEPAEPAHIRMTVGTPEAAKPGRYAAVASLSGALDMLGNYERRKKINPDYLAEMDDIYGSEKQLKNGKGNLNRLADKLAKTPEKAPKMYVACGTEDFLFEANEGFHARYGKVFDMEYHTEPGIHNWPFWNRHIERVLAWLPLEKAKDEE